MKHWCKTIEFDEFTALLQICNIPEDAIKEDRVVGLPPSEIEDYKEIPKVGFALTIAHDHLIYKGGNLEMEHVYLVDPITTSLEEAADRILAIDKEDIHDIVMDMVQWHRTEMLVKANLLETVAD